MSSSRPIACQRCALLVVFFFDSQHSPGAAQETSSEKVGEDLLRCPLSNCRIVVMHHCNSLVQIHQLPSNPIFV